MERAARLIQNTKLSKKVFSEEDLTRAVWPAAVGKAIAAHTSRLSLVRSTLVVEVEDAIWQRQLFGLRGQILDRLRRVTGSNVVEDLEFRVAIKRRQPQRAQTRQSQTTTGSTTPYDEADSIQDSVLKKVYRLSRKKATA
jgi:predicted nucleic acid-binding Zn ribbon protein